MPSSGWHPAENLKNNMNTKNISLLGLGLFAAVAISSCDKVEESLAKPIENPELPTFNSETVVYTPVTTLNVSDPDAIEIKVAECTATDLPAGYTFGGKLQLSTSKDFDNYFEVSLRSDSTTLYANPADLATGYSETYTKDPATVTLYGRTSLTAADGTDAVHIGSLDTYYGQTEYSFTPVNPGYYIAPAYYLVMGDGTNWDYSNAIKFDHSPSNPYDDPEFKLVAKSGSSMGDKWLILPEDTYNAVKDGGALAGNSYFVPVFDRAENGVNYGDLDEQTSGTISGTLPTLEYPNEVDINMLSKTYTSKVAVENYYVTGNGWSNWGATWMPLFQTDYINYYGFLNLETAFKFSPVAAWNGDFGSSKALSENANNGVYNYSGTLDRGKDDIQISHPGLYFAHLNSVDWTLTLDETSSWGMSGDFSGWSDDGDVMLTPSADLYTWTGELTVEEGQGWKFRANKAWTVNLGGTPDELWNNGGNIVLPEAGTYAITLDLSVYPAKFTAVKK